MNGERNAEDVGEVGNRSVEWEASPLPLLQPLPPPPHSAASPFGTTSLHPRNHVGTPTTVYHRRRPTSNRPAAKLLPVQGCANQPPCSGSPFTTLCLRGSIFSLAEKKKLANREEIWSGRSLVMNKTRNNPRYYIFSRWWMNEREIIVIRLF